MLKLIIIDDEVDACRILRTYLEEYPTNGIELVGEANSLKTGIELIHSLEPDIVLLDINLGDGIAFELLDHFPDLSFRVIFTTAYDQFALKAFKYSAVDYLLKPIEPDQLTAALVKTKIHFQKDVDFQAQLKILLKNIRTENHDRIALSSMEGIIFLEIKEIQYLHSDGSYTEFHTSADGKILVSKSIKEYENLLPDTLFCRIHQSFIVNINYVKKFMKEDGGYAILKDGTQIPISRRKKERFLNMIMG